MHWISPILGAICLGLVARDVFATLFNPRGRGVLSRTISRAVWQRFSRRQSSVGIAGPSIVLTVILTWVLLSALGWALIYWPFLPEAFLYADDMSRDVRTGFVTSLYISFVAIATLGLGDIAPVTGWMRLLLPLEAVVGFGLLSAGLSWVISLYPALSRQRSLALMVQTLREGERRSGVTVDRLDDMSAATILADLTARLIAVRNDLVQFPVAYYFHGRGVMSELPVAISWLMTVAQRGQARSTGSAARLHAAALDAALESIAAVITEQYFDDDRLAANDTLRRYARDVREDAPA